MMKKSRFILLLLTLSVLMSTALFAQEPGKVERIEKEIEREKLLREKIEKEKEKPAVEEKPVPREVPSIPAEKARVKKINVSGATILPTYEIEAIIADFENKELSLREMQMVADLITDAYRQRGLVTSRAYLPPQKIDRGILEIKVIEGVFGEVDIRGNRYFKSSRLREKITLEKGDPFNYNTLRRNLSRINEHPDRTSRAVLVPGKEPGATDVVLEVEDRRPIHIGFDWDNYGSRYIERDRYRTTLTHNNLSGRDDILTLQYQVAEDDTYWLTNLAYLFPFSENLRLGLAAARTKLDLGKEYEDLDARGKSKFYTIYAVRSLIDKEDLVLSLNLGFDYKDVFNFQAGEETSRDRLRVARVGLDLDVTDRFGRTLVINELHFGLPGIMGGLDSKDAQASRTGSGGKFIRNNLSLLRLQQMPFNSTLLWKNQFQFSPYTLAAAEQFQIGGVSSVRGYPPAEYVGDRGYATSLEWSFPCYPIPKEIKAPFSAATIYDALRLALFYDWAGIRLKSPPRAGEEKTESLRAAGWGVRFTLPEDFSARIDFGWPLNNNTPSDDDHLHTWVKVSKNF